MLATAVLVAALAAALVFSAAHAQIALDPESVVATTAGKYGLQRTAPLVDVRD